MKIVTFAKKAVNMNIYWLLFIVSLCISAIGWKKFLYFISIGYGFSIAGCALALIVAYRDILTLPTLLLSLLLLVYGCRLSGFLLLRGIKSSNYRKVLSENAGKGNCPVFVTATIWVSCAFLYLAEVSPVASRLYNISTGTGTESFWDWAGVVVMAVGIALETIADSEKAAAKKRNPNRYVDTGLYRIVRCPNYFGEMVTWTGCFIVCIGAGCNWWQWLIAAIGYVGIIYIMFSGARRLEIHQTKNYGADPSYQEYVKKTPILLPLIPIYSVARHSWLRG